MQAGADATRRPGHELHQTIVRIRVKFRSLVLLTRHVCSGKQCYFLSFKDVDAARQALDARYVDVHNYQYVSRIVQLLQCFFLLRCRAYRAEVFVAYQRKLPSAPTRRSNPPLPPHRQGSSNANSTPLGGRSPSSNFDNTRWAVTSSRARDVAEDRRPARSSPPKSTVQHSNNNLSRPTNSSRSRKRLRSRFPTRPIDPSRDMWSHDRSSRSPSPRRRRRRRHSPSPPPTPDQVETSSKESTVADATQPETIVIDDDSESDASSPRQRRRSGNMAASHKNMAASQIVNENRLVRLIQQHDQIT